MASGQIQTVLGDIEPSALGRTLTHEHIKMDYKCCIQPPWRASDEEKMVNSEINLANLGWIQHNPYSHKLNLSLGDEPFDDMVKELNLFKQEGGQSIVEVTINGINRDVEYLAKVSLATGLNIIAGTGYYIDHTLPPEIKALSVEERCKVSNIVILIIFTIRITMPMYNNAGILVATQGITGNHLEVSGELFSLFRI